ncbi:hypothetical protein [Luteolibacter sp. Populi]|uniref:hypothetical protein n=1 Tax=Luteolibacter sp. Populi TaxID=3230487 RepID=UPI003466EDC3
MVIPKLNIVSALAALVFFFLPWVSIECNGKRLATQTGVQMIVGATTPNPAFQSRMPTPRKEEKQSLGASYLAAAALIAVASALLVAFAGLIKGSSDDEFGAGILCTMALAFLLLQLALGFPAKREMQRALDERGQVSQQKNALEPLEKSIAEQLAGGLEIRPTQWFYLELAALGIPVLILGNALLDRIKAKET